jgi:V8-like Glu-specific endopeptidase
MRWPTPVRPRSQGVLATLAATVAALACAVPAPATAAPPSAAGFGASPSLAEAAAVAKVERFWTPRRMAEARPLDLVVDGGGRSRLRPGNPGPAAGGASASYAPVQTPEAPPYSVEGRIFIKQGRLKGYCSGTAINSPTRQLVLTAGHCVNSGPRIDGRFLKPAVASNYLEFVPAYSGGSAPFGAFVSRRSSIRALPQWIEQGNPDFDMGAFLTYPNAEGVDVADAVGGGATIVLGLTRHQTYKTFGYPGEKTHMEGCESSYVGDDPLTYPLPGPPTMAVKCRWAPGASGGGWLINEGFEVNGINTYLKIDDKSRTYGPYFTKETVGKLVRGY